MERRLVNRDQQVHQGIDDAGLLDEANRSGSLDVAFHALRHTHASPLIAAGVDIVKISKRLGHASPNITLSIYSHAFRKNDDKAAQAINSALAGFGAS
jgi:integrase